MDDILSLLSYLLIELPARAVTAFPDTPLPVIVFVVIAVVVLLTMMSGRRRKKRRR